MMIASHLRSHLLISVAILTAIGCGPRGSPPARGRDQSSAIAPTAPIAGAPRRPKPNPDALPPAGADVPPADRALQVVDGRERLVDVSRARAAGLTVVDLSDDWAPPVLGDGRAPDGTPLVDPYRAVFVGLANDRTDGDGQPLGAGEKNYLEPFGIPPSLSVLRARILADARASCAEVDRARLLAVAEIPTWGATTEQKQLAHHAARAQRLLAARRQAGFPDGADLAALGASSPGSPWWKSGPSLAERGAPAARSRGGGIPGGIATPNDAADGARSQPGDVERLPPPAARLGREVKAHLRFAAERAALGEVEKRVACEGLLDVAHHLPGRTDTPLRAAVYSFQQKHLVMAQGDLNRATLEALAKPPLELDFAALRRTLTERAVHAAGILEDGSAVGPDGEPASYLGSDGQRHPVPNLASAAADAVMAALDLVTPDDAAAFFARHLAGDFRRLRVVARFPELPEYYRSGQPLDLAAEIDRGDVWYDFPFDGKGERIPQPRERYPSFALYLVDWRGERVPLVRWRTTIGGWRAELAADGQEYYAYKASDVGPRVWRHIVAAPVWIPPPTSPLGSMVKEKRVNGAYIKVTNYDETGPGYLSAYGLVAAIHEQMHKGPAGRTFADNGIRTHGSFDYLSLRGRFSHGCHRLYNNLAVRLFSFIIEHHRARVLGPVALDFRRIFWWQGEVYDLRLPSRGFYFELEPPIPVETLEGRIRGRRAVPVGGYVRKPGVRYVTERPPVPDDSPASRAAGGGEP